MPRHFPHLLLLSAAVSLSACSDVSKPAGGRTVPTAPSATIVAQDTGIVRAELNSAYGNAGAGIRNAANTQLTNLFRSMTSNNIKAAQAQAFALCKYTQQQAAGGRLGSPAPTSTFLTTLCNDIYSDAQLAPGGIDVSGEDAIAVLIPACEPADVRLPNGRAGVRWDGGQISDPSTCTFPQDETLIISPIDYHKFPAGSGPLVYDGQQWGYFYEITLVPYNFPQSPHRITVGLCQVEDGTTYSPPDPGHDNLRVAHNVTQTLEGGGSVVFAEVLTPAAPFLTCFPSSAQADFLGDMRDHGALYAGRNALQRAGSNLLDLVTPTSLYAVHTNGLAGTAGSISPFGAVSTYGFSPTSIDRGTTTGGTTFTVTGPTGAALPTWQCAPTLWSSSNPSVGSFDGSPFYATSNGTTVITGYCQDPDVPGSARYIQQLVTITGPVIT